MSYFDPTDSQSTRSSWEFPTRPDVVQGSKEYTHIQRWAFFGKPSLQTRAKAMFNATVPSPLDSSSTTSNNTMWTIWNETAPLVATAFVSIVSVNLVFHYLAKAFRRQDGKSFSNVVTGSLALLSNKDSVLKREKVNDSMTEYERLYHGARVDIGSVSQMESIQTRQNEYNTLVDNFYNLVTDFYEWGWGTSFHFAPRLKGETFTESIKRSEYYVALRTAMTASTKAIDIGCGVGGPMRNIQAFTGADITGITLNEYQVKVGNQYCRENGVQDQCRVIQGDFQNLKAMFEPGTFDVAFAIEATCHSPNRQVCFQGVNHLLRDGGLFAGYEWAVLPERGFNKDSAEHRRIKEGIEVGNGLPTLATSADIVKMLENSGFEVLDSFDANRHLHSPHQVPWYEPLNGSLTASGFRMTRLGRFCTHCLVSILEFVRLAPRGTVRVSALLNATAIDLVEAGKQEMFTPSFFFLARKKQV